MRLARLAPFALLLAATPAFADAITYKGTVAGKDVVVELTEASDGPIVGRYAYLSNGIDIPLHLQSDADGKTVLAEEQPCTEKTCEAPTDGTIGDKFPVGAVWTLDAAPGADVLNGTWVLTGKSKQQKVALTRLGSRPLLEDADVTVMALQDFTTTLTYDFTVPLTLASAPYEWTKLQAPLTAQAPQTLDGSTFHYAVDPRSKLAFPRIDTLADGSDPGAANNYLADIHGRHTLDALNCPATRYLGLGWIGTESGATLGGYEDEQITVDYLTPTVMTWTESGSLWCNGAHPYNHSNAFNLDVKAGAILNNERVFKDWVPKAYGEDTVADVAPSEARADPDNYAFYPSDALIAYVKKNRNTDSSDAECGIDDLIPTNLAMRFAPGDHVIFDLEGLPNVIEACQRDLLDVKLADIKDMLTPEAVTLFPGLK